MDKDFMESVWWAFKELYDKGKIYEGEKVLMYDTKFATPVSKNEVTMDNDAYQTVTDPSVYVKFRVKKPIKSFLMGVEIPEKDLEKLGIKFQKIGEHYGLEIPESKLSEYEKFIAGKMLPEFWNEYVKNDEAVFLFKMANGEIERYIWSKNHRDDEERIGQLAKEFSGSFNGSVKTMLENNEFYGEGVLDTKYLLAWTTTPWTLPANMALAVSPKLKYVEVAVDGEHLILAKDLVVKVLVDEKRQPLPYEIVREMSGKELVGLEYFPILPDENTSVVSKKVVKQRIIDEVKKLGLRDGEYAISGGALLDVYGMRQSDDIDLLVTRELFDVFSKNSDWKPLEKHGSQFLKNDSLNAEMNYQFSGLSYDETQNLIKNGTDISGVRFISVKDTIKWKRDLAREIDLADIEMLEKIATNQTAHKVYSADYVETDMGTGLIHLAPA
jgi:hypothetical protein